MFQKILIANRGEIACRVAATAARLAIRTVAVYSDADAQALHVQACDEAVHLGGSAPQESYLRWDVIIAAAQATGAQAIHPGYGFLSENADFAQACADAGLVFIGPPPAAIRAMGRKAESKHRMAQAGVPLVPGYHGIDQDAALLQREADRIGYPVLIKASAGGGGMGMRVVERAQDFGEALASCQREAIHSFGDGAVLLEKYLQRPRHIEIQVFGDIQGHYVYLFERDCSVQRRHQKVLEEAPAPGMTEALRAQMGQAAVAAARAVGYVGAGTVEFIVEPASPEFDGHTERAAGTHQGASAFVGGSAAREAASMGAFFFMEMNTRLQVEHPVTEAITGLDLVEWQLRVAAGEPLPLQQADLCIQGHAIEARICAESPDKQFLPATGTLQVYTLPPHTRFACAPQGVRVDSGVRQGDAISPFYDSMVAKLIVHGSTRQEALARLDAALMQTHIVGLATNVQFLRQVAATTSFSQAQLDTALITREAATVFHQEKVGLALAAAALVAYTLDQELQQAQAMQRSHPQGWMDPWARRDGWRAHGASQRSFAVRFQEQAHTLLLTRQRDQLQLQVGDTREVLRFERLGQGGAGATLDIRWGRQRLRAQVHAQGELLQVFTPLGATSITRVDALAHAGETPAEGARLSAPMPGKVLSFAVAVGDAVTKGQALAVMEAMKMEHTIAAPSDGTVAELLYAPGDQVPEGAELLRLALKSGVAS